jgi:hypothetical protein
MVPAASTINIFSSAVLVSAPTVHCQSDTRITYGLLKTVIWATLVDCDDRREGILNLTEFPGQLAPAIFSALYKDCFRLFQIICCCQFEGKPQKPPPPPPRHPIVHLRHSNSILFSTPPPGLERTQAYIDPYYVHRVLKNHGLTDNVIWSLNSIQSDSELRLVFRKNFL